MYARTYARTPVRMHAPTHTHHAIYSGIYSEFLDKHLAIWGGERDILKVQEKPVLLRARSEWDQRCCETRLGVDSADSDQGEAGDWGGGRQ